MGTIGGLHGGALISLLFASAPAFGEEYLPLRIKTDTATGFYLIRQERYEELDPRPNERPLKVAQGYRYGPHPLNQEPLRLLVGAYYQLFPHCESGFKAFGQQIGATPNEVTMLCHPR